MTLLLLYLISGLPVRPKDRSAQVSSCPKTYSEAMTCPGDSSYEVGKSGNHLGW